MSTLCLFSGGLDSTFLLITTLKSGDIVYPVYIDTCIYDTQKELEIQQSKRIIESLRETYPNLRTLTQVEVTVPGPSSFISLNQPSIWILGALYALDTCCDVTNIVMGYVLGDQALAFVDEMQALWKALTGFFLPSRRSAIPTLSFPIKQWSKSEISSYITDNHMNIYEQITWCEQPKLEDGVYHTCGMCHSCEVMKFWTGSDKRYYEKDKKDKARLRSTTRILSHLGKEDTTVSRKTGRETRLKSGKVAKRAKR